MEEVKRFKAGRDSLLKYLNSLVSEKKAVLLEDKDEDYCERHETSVHSWAYQLIDSNSKVCIGTGPLLFTTDYKKCDFFSMSVESSDKTVSEKLMENLEKIAGVK